MIIALAVILASASIGVAVHRSHGWASAVMRADPETIMDSPAIRDAAIARGRDVFVAHCASCHGATGKGSGVAGVPDLTDQDYLVGDYTISNIEQITLHGIRAGVSKTQGASSMPAYASARPYGAEPIPPLSPQDIRDVADFLLMARGTADRTAAKRGAVIFGGRGGCWDCHGRDGGGDQAIGAPNLMDTIWLYGGSPQAIRHSIAWGRHGVSPAFARLLSPLDARSVAVYVASLSAARPKREN